ncbi:MAG: cell division protein FtsZ [Treponema sp.]|nr:cell division protein FtsZ [Treponema sp.]
MDIFRIEEFKQLDEIKADSSQPPAKVVVLGLGTAGLNAVNHMIDNRLQGVDFYAINTDKQHLDEKSKAENRIHIGNKTTGIRGAGGDPVKGEAAAREDAELLRKTVKDIDMVFLTTGMGGGTGTGAIPVLAGIAKDSNALTVAIVTLPFEVEGEEKMQIALEGIKKLRENVDTLIIIPNENLYKMIDRKLTFIQMLRLADDILLQAVKAISEIITQVGYINADFADVVSTMKGQGDAHLGIGLGSGDNRAKTAADNAINNPLLEDVSITGASRLLVNIAGSEDVPAAEVREILSTIRAKAGAKAKLKFAITHDSSLGENIKVTVIATGLQNVEKGAIITEDPMKKTETVVDFINHKQFEAMKGQEEKIVNEKYGNFYKPNDFKFIQEVPAISRKGSFADNNYSDRFTANERNA